MIDFRYHIVSLISVFLALAVGIALGAGPLGETIGSELQDQVEQLRTERNDLRAELDETTALLAQESAYLDAASDELIAGVLPRAVAVVALAGADPDVVSGITERLEQAGATITARLAVTETWTDDGEEAFRSSLVGNLLGYLDPAPPEDAPASAILGAALAQAVTSGRPEDPTQFTDNASLLLEVLASGNLLTVSSAPSRPAEGVVVVAPPTTAGTETPAPSEESGAALLALASALADRPIRTVVGGPAGDGTDLVAAIRATGDLASRVATVDTVFDITGQLSTPRALAAALAGTVGHYGFADSASSVLPPRVEEPTPAPTGEATGVETAG